MASGFLIEDSGACEHNLLRYDGVEADIDTSLIKSDNHIYTITETFTCEAERCDRIVKYKRFDSDFGDETDSVIKEMVTSILVSEIP